MTDGEENQQTDAEFNIVDDGIDSLNENDNSNPRLSISSATI